MNNHRPRIIVNQLIQRVFEGRVYHFCRRINNVTYVKCKYRRIGCHGTAKISALGHFQVINANHTCGAPEEDLATKRQFLNNLRNLCTHQFRNIKQIYEQVVTLFPEMRRKMPYEEIRRRLKSWQKNANFPAANNFNRFALTLRNGEYHHLLTHNNGRMTVRVTNVSAVFGDRHLTNLIADEVENDENIIYISNSKTILSEHNILNNSNFITFVKPFQRYGIPTGWAILSDESEETYCRIFDDHFDVMAPAINPEIIYTNFNITLHLSLQQKFLHADIKTLFMPYFLDVVHNARLLNLDLNDIDVKQNVKKLISIALLPAPTIPHAFLTFKNEILGNQRERYEDLLVYYLNTWIRTVGPVKLSFFNDIRAFKNLIDGHWRMIEYEMKRADNIWDLTRVMFNHHIKYYGDIEKLNGNRQNISRVASIQCIVISEHLTNLWNSWARNTLNITEFLENSSTLFEKLFVDSIHRNELEGLEAGQFIEGEDRFNNDEILLPEEQIEVEANPATEEERAEQEAGQEEEIEVIIEEENNPGVEIEEEAVNEEAELIYQREDEVPAQDYTTPSGLCLTCESRNATIRFRPCRHVLMCQICLDRYKTQREYEREQLVCILCNILIETEVVQ